MHQKRFSNSFEFLTTKLVAVANLFSFFDAGCRQRARLDDILVIVDFRWRSRSSSAAAATAIVARRGNVGSSAFGLSSDVASFAAFDAACFRVEVWL